jgi:RNA polymerase-binding transcription factor
MIQPAEGSHPGTKSPLTEDQLGHFHDLLIEERDKARESLSRLQRDAIQENPDNMGDTTVRTHLADLGSQAFEQEENFGLAEQFSEVLGTMERALGRLGEGTYGVCEACGAPIPVERLEAIPYAIRCAGCQARAESGEEPED